ncbi:unnamed protein product, partial [Musa acuminata subsp. burmannicoides]
RRIKESSPPPTLQPVTLCHRYAAITHAPSQESITTPFSFRQAREAEEAMKNELRLLPLSLLLFVAVSSWEHTVRGVEFRQPAATGVGCNGSIAECHAEAEFLMDSEIHRRFLADGGHISIGVLIPNRLACNAGGGQPYGKCLPARSGNQPNRGCSAYNKCRVDKNDDSLGRAKLHMFPKLLRKIS